MIDLYFKDGHWEWHGNESRQSVLVVHHPYRKRIAWSLQFSVGVPFQSRSGWAKEEIRWAEVSFNFKKFKGNDEVLRASPHPAPLQNKTPSVYDKMVTCLVIQHPATIQWAGLATLPNFPSGEFQWEQTYQLATLALRVSATWACTAFIIDAFVETTTSYTFLVHVSSSACQYDPASESTP